MGAEFFEYGVKRPGPLKGVLTSLSFEEAERTAENLENSSAYSGWVVVRRRHIVEDWEEPV